MFNITLDLFGEANHTQFRLMFNILIKSFAVRTTAVMDPMWFNFNLLFSNERVYKLKINNVESHPYRVMIHLY